MSGYPPPNYQQGPGYQPAGYPAASHGQPQQYQVPMNPNPSPPNQAHAYPPAGQAPPTMYPQAPAPMYAQPTPAPMYTQAPAPQVFQHAGSQHMHVENLESLTGVVVKEASQWGDAVMEALGAPYEQANKYKVKAMPAGVRPVTSHNDTAGWSPSSPEIDAMPNIMSVEEESSCCLRALLAAMGGLNLRALTLHMYQGGQERYTVERPCRLGYACCCPLEMLLHDRASGSMIGAVLEGTGGYCGTCYECCCCCTCRQRVMVGGTRQSLVHKYSLKNSCCCCGRVDNCCGGTCCKPYFFIDVVDPNDKLVTSAVKTYGGDRGGDCCRCTFDFNNYILPFPASASHNDRMLLLTALMSVEYAYHSRQGGENNDN